MTDVTSIVPVSNETVLERVLPGPVVAPVIAPTVRVLARISTEWPFRLNVPLAAGVPAPLCKPTAIIARPLPAAFRRVKVPPDPLPNCTVPNDFVVPMKSSGVQITLVPVPLRLRTTVPPLLTLPPPTVTPFVTEVTLIVFDVAAKVSVALARFPNGVEVD